MPDKIRTVRVDDALWTAAATAAEKRGETISEAVRRFLRGYVRRAEKQVMLRPPRP